ncbi:hypothetical protein FGG08_001031 [Glutinoglossum americanum]|uniref:HECT-type E3 ubiquitin transferase n=1 Tax=Glutinoglossum americanum TaxID=1670608 RepID=A0A9P8I8Y4_9PEZI|nr:hypothetical protein FGG08_001031 [Glutinoglossum americanum]
MAKIRKTAGPKHEATLSPALLKFVNTSIAVPLYQLPAHLSTFPLRWPFPRGDLYHWIPLLNRFDHILELFNHEYGLKDNVQIRPFERQLLANGDGELGQASYTPPSEGELEALGFGKEGDRELVEAVLVFSRMLLENCGNRSLYSSSGQLNDILNTTSLSLLNCALRLGVRLAQRYHASRQRTVGATSHINSALLLSHYNINLDKVQKLAAPFVKSLPPAEPAQPLSPVTPGKGKEKSTSGGAGSLGRASPVIPVHATDLVALAKGAPAPISNIVGEGADGKKPARTGDAGWEEWGNVWLSYYMNTSSVTGDAKIPAAHGAGVGPAPQIPVTPTPSRRNTGLGQHQTPRHSRLSSLEDSPGSQSITSVQIPEETRSGGMKVVEIPYSKLSASTPLELLRVTLPETPQESHYDLLTRLRVASALTTSLVTRREILAVRILAITNLAYVHPEVVFQQKVLQQDSDEPRRLQLAYQLAELVHPPGDRDASIPRWLQTLALGGLEALAKHKTKAPDVCSALSVNVTHGVLLYVVRKAVAEMRVERSDNESLDEDEWREALFSLLSFLPSTARTGEALVSAGLIPILVEVLTIRTSRAERNHPKVLNFLDTFVYNVRDAFQSLANSKGLDAISDLVAFEVDSAFKKALNGEGIPVEYRNQATDYDIPYFQQQTLRALFKFMHHMMGHSGGNFDRLLRNLIDSSQLLGGLRIVLKNAKVFGANVWSGAVNILSSFIHNEPTSYAVIAEAGLSKGLLEAVTCKDIIVPEEDKREPVESARGEAEHGSSVVIEEARGEEGGIASGPHLAADAPGSGQKILTSRDRPLARGILPASDTIACIPQAFGAICLNSAGMRLFQASDAFESFFEVFESPEHVKCMDSETDLPGILGSSFDELVRHHPQLKPSVLDSVFAMVVRVGSLVRSRASEKGVGTKLWVDGENAKIQVSGGWGALGEKQNDLAKRAENTGSTGDEKVVSVARDEGGDVQMSDADASIIACHSSQVTTTGRAALYEDVVEMEDEKDGPSVSVYLEVIAKFLGGFFSNTPLCCAFIDMGGVEYVLDFCMLQSLPYDFGNRPASQAIARVVHALVEQKPHLVIPSLLHRTQAAVDQLKPFVGHEEKVAYFAPLTNRGSSGLPETEETALLTEEDVKGNGTVYAKSLVAVLNLCHVLAESFSQPMFNHRSAHTIFTQVNLTDMYQRLVEDLGKLHRSCVWEEILLEKNLPELWNEATRLEGFGLGSNEADNIMGLVNIEGETQDNADTTAPSGTSAIESIAEPLVRATSTNGASMTKAEDKAAMIKRDEATAQFKNVRTLRYLLSQVPSSITNFFQGLARALVAKRSPESYQKQNAFIVADALGGNLLQQLVWRRETNPSVAEQYPYWIVMLTSLSQLLVEGPIERPHHQTLTLVLQAFRKAGGFEVLKEILDKFCVEIQEQLKPAPERASEKDSPARLTSAYGGIKIILTLFSQLVSSKNVHESTQTVAISSRDRDKDKPDYFHPSQFLVELRMAILPTVQKMWESDFFVDKASNSIVKCLIDILRTTLEGDGENGAYKRSDKITPRGKATPKELKPDMGLVRSLTSAGFADDLAREALFRCNNNFQMAQEYCTSQSNHKRVHRYPIPPTAYRSSRQQTAASVPNADAMLQEMVDSAEEGAPSLPLPLVSEGHSALLDNLQAEIEEAGSDGSPDRTTMPPPPAPGVPGEGDSPDEGLLAMSIDNLLGNINVPPQLGLGSGVGNQVGDGGSAVSTDGSKATEAGKLPDVVTVDDLDERRATIRKQLIDRSLDVLNNPAHSDVTFELADLIKNAVSKSTLADEMRKEIGETLVQSLLSLQMEEDFRPQGKKIAAYAHLLGLILQTKLFYDATRDELKENFSILLGFIKILPGQPAEESSPWIANILLIVEKLLSEAAQPRQIKWTLPNDGERPSTPVAELPDAFIPLSAQTELFEAIVEVLPKIGKDETLALSVARTLVILTRHRELAIKLGEKRNLQRLFVMIKQLAGINTDRIQSSIMLILRHVIEDDDTLRNIMRSDIVAWYESRRESRQVDTSSYVRHLYYLILRNPEIFVEVTNEKMKLVRYDPNSRHQHLALKKEEKPQSEDAEEVAPEEGDASDKGQETISAEKKDEVKVTNETDGKDTIDKHKGVEVKLPVVENPDGVIHYLLCELLSYKEADDKEPAPVAKDIAKEAPKNASPAGQTDVEMTNGDTTLSTSTSTPAPVSTLEAKKGDKQEFKADQHPIFIYRCFILQCLTELLSCYNRTKIEFINFSRKGLPQPNTPSKPRSGVLNYLLNDLIPVGSLNHSEDTTFRKKYSTSNWAISVIVSLTSKTGERGYKARDLAELEEESDLLYVRKFVLEHTLKAYKDASASGEALDAKYARMLNIADLFNRMLTGRPNSGGGSVSADMLLSSQKQLAKIMFEKNFISAFTNSLADIDLNFPGAKRAVKYILRPLKLLTQTAIDMSESSIISTAPGQVEDETEISTASSSVSDSEGIREETPDLFRNSTLGLFEPGREDETDSESSDGDEEMYDDEYGDEMDYDEEMPGDNGDIVSDEDEEIDVMEGLPSTVGVDVEVVINPEEDDGTDEDDSDDSDEMDEGEEIEVIDEIDGDDGDENFDGAGDEDEEWQSDDDEEDFEGNGELDEDIVVHGLHDSPLHHIVRALEGENGLQHAVQQMEHDIDMELDPEGYMEDDMQDDEGEIEYLSLNIMSVVTEYTEDLSEEEDEDEDMDDEDLIYEEGPEFEDEDAGLPILPWGWDADGDAPLVTRGHHHHHRTPNQWYSLGGPRDPGSLAYRAHRPGLATRGTDDGINPLLQRGATPTPVPGRHVHRRHEAMSDWVHAINAVDGRRGILNSGPVSMLNNLIDVLNSNPALLPHRHAAFHLSIQAGPGGVVPPEVRALLGIRHGAPQEIARSSRDDPATAVSFVPTVTSVRWQEEARLLYGSLHTEKAHRVLTALLSVLVPPAIEEERIRKQKAEEEARKLEEERARQLEEARIAKEKAEKEEKEKKETEEREAAAKAAVEAEAAVARAQEGETIVEGSGQAAEEPSDGQPMEGIEPTQNEAPTNPSPAVEAGPSEIPAPRAVTMVRGRELDITGMDIDPGFLEALPEDLREEVLMQQIQERRQQAASSGEQPSEISQEFLEALPDDIREEILQQEAQDRRRREREEARRRAQANGEPAQPADIDVPTFLASLDPGLRQAVLLEQDEEVLAQLPQAIAAEANALRGDARLSQFIPRQGRARGLEVDNHRSSDQPSKKPQRKAIVQMLDKAGVATLLRLMFIPQQGSARQTLNGILQNICENRQNRAEVVSLLLSILQDGSADMSAVERSFAHLSLRARQPALQKTPQSLKRALNIQYPQNNSEMSPLMVVQQCLASLVFLTQWNRQIPSFFLTEHEAPVGLKRSVSRKGKGKENRASKFALNSLLSLLDRKLIMENSSVMEQLSSLLNSITQPLMMLHRKEKEKPGEALKEGVSSEPAAQTENTAIPPAEELVQTLETSSPAAGNNSAATSSEPADITVPDAPATGDTIEPSGSDSKSDEKTITDHQEAKKVRMPLPPVVPEHNLRLVINILAARECSAKTFRETLSTINNLSAIPEAKEIFGKELVRQAQSLGQSILQALEDLVPQIKSAETGTDVQGMALAKFSPASSDQAKLLRVLTALDYLFDPKKADGKGRPADKGKEADDDSSKQKEDLLTSLYENPIFSPLWAKLSECLSAIRQRENMLNVATILLPLIEALMVVCKNTTLKDSPISRAQKEHFAIASPPPESRMESLFFTFTEDHRKILNDLVRQNPKLMSGTFSLLVKNPKVLEFDNKRNYFSRRLHPRGAETRQSVPALQLNVRRDQVFLDSYKSMYYKNSDEMKYGKLSIRFHGEEGVDAGGVTREWFQVLSRQMFNPDYALFTPVASDRTTFHPNRLSGVNTEHFSFFKFIGRIIGKALYEGRVLDCHFSRAVYKRILGKPVSIKDMETLDLDYYKSLVWMLENDITDIITETFSVETDAFGESQTIDLIPDGHNTPVTEENKHEYVRLVVEYRLTGSVQEQLEHFLNGFHDIVPAELISIFDEQELELLISGLPDVDVDDWKNNTEYHNYSASSPQIQWFWRAVRSFDKEERAKLLQFVTGTSKVPLNGFKELEGMNGFSRFNIHRDYGNKDRLPSSHTCFNQLDLPEYESYETLRQLLYTAITAGSEYFGFA